MVAAAKNPKCTRKTLEALSEMGLEIEKQVCETGANVLMYYVRYAEKVDYDTVKWLLSKGCDIKLADKNKMNILHYMMINMNVTADDL